MPHRSLTRSLISLPPLQRRLLLIAMDGLMLPVAVWLSFWLRLNDLSPDRLLDSSWLVAAAPLVGLPLYALSGQYKGLTRYVGSRSLYQLALRNGALVLLLLAIGVMLTLPLPPRSSWILLWVLLTALTGSVRFALRDLLLDFGRKPRQEAQRVVIFGAGDAGAQLFAALRLGGKLSVVAFIDDRQDLQGRDLAGVPIHAAKDLPRLMRSQPVQQVLLAMPSLGRSRRRQIVEDLSDLGVSVLQVPSLEEITSGQARIDTLRPIAIEELLGRDAVPPDPQLLGPGVAGKVVLVSGAGGSIGSELCRQILRLGPRKLILLERHEFSLYALHAELKACGPTEVELICQPSCITNEQAIETLFAQQGVQVIFHAAAFKHVPMMEHAPLDALRNNVFGTLVIARAAARFGVESFTFISTDKAVRPTNIMGASKRVAELLIQALAEEQRERSIAAAATSDVAAASASAAAAAAASERTRFHMVRFGNVLGSSGSVVPLFREQIAKGGPITLTHPDVIRYFMTIPEAVQLVLQAAALSEGGEIFLLDMGEPVRIMDLAKEMIRLSGLSLRHELNPNGDIEIHCTGLRPGEKLFEELLIDAESQASVHPLIYCAQDRSLPPDQLWPLLAALLQAINGMDWPAARQLLAELVPEWQPHTAVPASSVPTSSVPTSSVPGSTLPASSPGP